MTEKGPQKAPYKTLGTYLHTLRNRVKESLAEVSGAVEIDETELDSIENGERRPSEDILLLLITHLGIQDDEAVKLWELAGYDRTQQDKTDFDTTGNRPLIMVMTIDSRIVYSDKVEVVASSSGVVLNFLQAPDGPYQTQTVARIGMSREQSENFLRVLKQTLTQSAQITKAKELPSPETKNNPDS